MKKYRPVYPHENILNRYMLTNQRIGESLPLIKVLLFEYMRTEDIRYYEKLPDEVMIYRGTSLDEFKGSVFDVGQSWTLNKEVARFFAYDYYNTSENRCILKATINKNNIFAFVNDREEKECIIDTSKLLNSLECINLT